MQSAIQHGARTDLQIAGDAGFATTFYRSTGRIHTGGRFVYDLYGRARDAQPILPCGSEYGAMMALADS